MIKPQTLYNLFLAKTRSRMTTAVMFSRQNDAGSHARTTWYWENLVLVVVSESKGLYYLNAWREQAKKRSELSIFSCITSNLIDPGMLTAEIILDKIYKKKGDASGHSFYIS